MQRALGDAGFAVFQQERGVRETYTLTAVQADAILQMTLGQLVNLEQEKLGGEHQQAAGRNRRIPAHPVRREEHSVDIIRDDLPGTEAQVRRRAAHRNQRRGNRRRSISKT